MRLLKRSYMAWNQEFCLGNLFYLNYFDWTFYCCSSWFIIDPCSTGMCLHGCSKIDGVIVVLDVLFKCSSIFLFRMASVVSKIGFVFVQQGFSKMLIPLCVSISICCSGTGFYYQVFQLLKVVHRVIQAC